MDAQHRVIAAEELFRGTLTQTSVYPREVVKASLKHKANYKLMLYSVIIGAIATKVSNNAAFNYAGITVQPQEKVMQMVYSTLQRRWLFIFTVTTALFSKWPYLPMKLR